MKKMYLAMAAFLMAVVAFSQGVTTSSIGGKITDPSEEPLLGANIVAIHVPSNTTYGAITDFDGFYRISGMRIGGPYTITISYVGFEDEVKHNVYLSLGQTERISTQLGESATELEEVIVIAQTGGSFDSGRRERKQALAEDK